MWFSVVSTLIDNDTSHYSGQSFVDSRGAAEWVPNKFWPLWWPVSLSIKLYAELNHIRFVFYHNIKETKSLSWQLNLKVHALHYANELLVPVRLFQKLLQTRLICRNNSKKCLGKEHSLSIRVHTTKNHISIYFLPQCQRQRKCFFRARAEKGIA